MKQCIYVEFDAFLDTRLGTVSSLDQDVASKLVLSDAYFNRVLDDFETVESMRGVTAEQLAAVGATATLLGIDKETYRTAYAKRDTSILQRSIMTDIPLVLKDLIMKLEWSSVNTPEVEETAIEFNIWPYELEEKDKEFLLTALMAYSGLQTKAELVSYAPEQLTPTFVKSQYTGMIMYNLRDWLECHMEEFKHVRMPLVAIIAPALYRDEAPGEQDLQVDGMRRDVTPFELAELAFVELFKLHLIHIKHFCIFRPDKAA